MNTKLLQISIISSLLLLFLSSCFEEDKTIPGVLIPHEPGAVQVKNIEQNIYLTQSYYNLVNGETVYTIDNADWDLGFESTENGWRIILNTSRFMRAAKTGSVVFEQISGSSGLDWLFDASNGHPDSTAIGEWFSIGSEDTIYTNEVFVLDRGMDYYGLHYGYAKVQFLELASGIYTFRMSNLDGTNDAVFSVQKNLSVNYTKFSFNSGGVISGEPTNAEWQLLFTRYTTMLFAGEEPYPYIVAGVLINQNNVSVYRNENLDFESITIENVDTMTFITNQDAIGYEWKYYNFDAGTYDVLSNKIFIIKDFNELYYKLHFLNYYNQEGEKGFPVIEFQRL